MIYICGCGQDYTTPFPEACAKCGKDLTQMAAFVTALETLTKPPVVPFTSTPEPGAKPDAFMSPKKGEGELFIGGKPMGSCKFEYTTDDCVENPYVGGIEIAPVMAEDTWAGRILSLPSLRERLVRAQRGLANDANICDRMVTNMPEDNLEKRLAMSATIFLCDMSDEAYFQFNRLEERYDG